MVTFGGQEIYKSPFEVNVGPYKETMIRAYGPGLTGGLVNYPAMFTVETNGETGALGNIHIYIYISSTDFPLENGVEQACNKSLRN